MAQQARKLRRRRNNQRRFLHWRGGLPERDPRRGGVNAKRDDYWQHVYVAFKPISFLDKFRSERVFRRPLGR